MSAANSNRTIWRILTVCAATALMITVGWLIIRPKKNVEPKPGPRPFVERAADVGIAFDMRFLPNEQGETFKINLYDHGSGLAVGDYDGDGHDDIYFVNQLGKNALYRNQGNGKFIDVTEEAGVAIGDRVCVAATFADYDNDGKLDLFVTSTRGGNTLFHNVGGGKFENATEKAGLTHVGHSQTALFFDYDGDGFLDLFVANTADWTDDKFDQAAHYFPGKGAAGLGQVVHSPKESNILYRNNGKGAFENVTEKAGLKGRGWAGDAIAFDYNEDGKPDLFVTCMFGRAQLYRNDGGGKFTDVTLEVLGKTPWGGLGAKLFDFNNDGRLDLLVVDMHSDMWMGPDFEHRSLELAQIHTKAKFRYYNGPHALSNPNLIEEERALGKEIDFRHDDVLFGNACYRNDGGGKFTEVSDQAGLETFWPWGIATGDFDNDGFEDVFIPAGMGYPFYYWPNSLLINQGDGTFRESAEQTGIEPPTAGIYLPQPIAGKPAVRSSRAAVTGDFNGDGRLEIVVNNFNGKPYFFENRFPQKNYLAFRLLGAQSNRDAIGAVVRVHQGPKIMTRIVHASSGYLSQSSKTLHFGLGENATVDRVEIVWPNGSRQRLDLPKLNAINDVVEPAGDPKK